MGDDRGDHEQAIEWARLGLSRAAATSSGAGGVDDPRTSAARPCHSIAAFAWWSVGRRGGRRHAGVLAALVDRLAPWHEYTATLFSFSAKEQFEERDEQARSDGRTHRAPSVAPARFYQGVGQDVGGG
ncbi:MAG: hypothetical protein R2713_23685 [Ilumatobacteraceae bacterium]